MKLSNRAHSAIDNYAWMILSYIMRASAKPSYGRRLPLMVGGKMGAAETQPICPSNPTVIGGYGIIITIIVMGSGHAYIAKPCVSWPVRVAFRSPLLCSAHASDYGHCRAARRDLYPRASDICASPTPLGTDTLSPSGSGLRNAGCPLKSWVASD